MQSGILNHSRFIRQFKTLGPYIRIEQCTEECYFFDCLAICVSARVDPSCREFWGWWLTLQREETKFFYSYQMGLFNEEGDWQPQEIPRKKQEEIQKTLNVFYERLSELLNQLECELHPSADLDKDKVISAA